MIAWWMGVRARVSTTFALGSPWAIHRQLKPHGESVRHLVVENGKRSLYAHCEGRPEGTSQAAKLLRRRSGVRG